MSFSLVYLINSISTPYALTLGIVFIVYSYFLRNTLHKKKKKKKKSKY